MRKLLLISSLLFLVSFASLAQERSPHALFASVGLNINEADVVSGAGLAVGVGYQRTLGKPWLRLVPSLNFASYTNQGTEDIPDALLNSTSLKVNLNADVLTAGAFSVVVGAGLTGNHSAGLLGTGGNPGRRSSEYFSRVHLAVNALVGFRLVPVASRIGYELLIADVSIGGKRYGEEVGVLQFRLLFDVR